MKKFLITILIVLIESFFLTQLQPAAIRFAGGVAGSFGVRPISHQCFGFVIAENEKEIFPAGEFEFVIFLFHFRYSVMHEDGRSLCAGQDIWYGE